MKWITVLGIILLGANIILISYLAHLVKEAGATAVAAPVDAELEGEGGNFEIGDNNEDTDSRSAVLGLLLHKKVSNVRAVESMDLVINYIIYNIGNETVKNVVLSESSIDPQDFDIIGNTVVNLGRIQAGHNITHVIVIKPLKSGYLSHFKSAAVNCTIGNDDTVHTMYSNEQGDGYILPFADFTRNYSPHFMSWFAFLIMCMPPIVIPFILWSRSDRKYESIVAAAALRRQASKTRRGPPIPSRRD